MAVQVSAPGSVKEPEPVNALPLVIVTSGPASTAGFMLFTVIIFSFNEKGKRSICLTFYRYQMRFTSI